MNVELFKKHVDMTKTCYGYIKTLAVYDNLL